MKRSLNIYLLTSLSLLGYAQFLYAQSVPSTVNVQIKLQFSESDTTAAWRYFPISVGNRWEYSGGGMPGKGFELLREVIGTSVIDNVEYFIMEQTILIDGNIDGYFPPMPVRYDSVSSFVATLRNGQEEELFYVPCPLNAHFGQIVDCRLKGGGFVLYEVQGEHGANVIFSSPIPDTLTTSVKYYYDQGFIQNLIYASGIGEISLSSDVYSYGIRYAKVGDSEYGYSTITLNTDDALLTSDILISPNPTRGHIDISSAEMIKGIRIYDIRGRLLHSANNINTRMTSVSLDNITGLNHGTVAISIETTRGSIYTKIVTLIK